MARNCKNTRESPKSHLQRLQNTLLQAMQKGKSTRQRSLAIEIFKAIHGISPKYIQELFKLKTSSYTLRDPLKLEVPSRHLAKHGWDPSVIREQSYGIVCHLILNKSPNLVLQKVINKCNGPKCKCTQCKYFENDYL